MARLRQPTTTAEPFDRPAAWWPEHGSPNPFAATATPIRPGLLADRAQDLATNGHLDATEIAELRAAADGKRTNLTRHGITAEDATRLLALHAAARRPAPRYTPKLRLASPGGDAK